MSTIKAVVPAWMSSSSYEQQKFCDARAEGDNERMASALSYYPQDMSSIGWTQVGIATIEVEIEDDNKIRQNMVSTLQKQKEEVLAKAQQEATQIEERIQNLLAIGYEEAAS